MLEKAIAQKQDTRLLIVNNLFVITALVVLAFLLCSQTVLADDTDNTNKKVIRSAGGAKITITKAERSRRPAQEGEETRLSRRVAPTAEDPAPTEMTLEFPTLVYPGETVRGRLKFYDPDDFVFSIFITVIFPDGDVVTESLYDYRIDGGDIYKGKYYFWIELPGSQTPIPGKIIITCSDEYLNVSEVTQNFVLMY